MLEKWVGLTFSFFLAMGLLQVRMGHASISLPKPSFDGKVSVEKAIKERRTIRDFKERTLSLAYLSQLLWAAQGITDPTIGRRAAPSGGALYPLDIYVLIGENGVEKMEAGIYDELVKSHIPYVVHASTKSVLSEPSTLRQAQGERWVEALMLRQAQQNGISIGYTVHPEPVEG
jgi:nitroreductase